MSIIDSEIIVPSDSLFRGSTLVEKMMTYAVEFMQDRLQTLDKITEINLSFAEKWGKRIPDLKFMDRGFGRDILLELLTEPLEHAACTARLRDALGASHGPISQLKSYVDSEDRAKTDRLRYEFDMARTVQKANENRVESAKQAYHRIVALQGKNTKWPCFRDTEAFLYPYADEIKLLERRYTDALACEYQCQGHFLEAARDAVVEVKSLEMEKVRLFQKYILSYIDIMIPLDTKGSQREARMGEVKKNIMCLDAQSNIDEAVRKHLELYEFPTFQEYKEKRVAGDSGARRMGVPALTEQLSGLGDIKDGMETMSTASSMWSEAELSASIFCSSSGSEIYTNELDSEQEPYSWTNKDGEEATFTSQTIPPASDVTPSGSYESLGFGSVSEVSGGGSRRETHDTKKHEGNKMSMRASRILDGTSGRSDDHVVIYRPTMPSLSRTTFTSARGLDTAHPVNTRPRRLGEPISMGVLNQRAEKTDAFTSNVSRHRRLGDAISVGLLNQRTDQAYASSSKNVKHRRPTDRAISVKSFRRFDSVDSPMSKSIATTVGSDNHVDQADVCVSNTTSSSQENHCLVQVETSIPSDSLSFSFDPSPDVETGDSLGPLPDNDSSLQITHSVLNNESIAAIRVTDEEPVEDSHEEAIIPPEWIACPGVATDSKQVHDGIASAIGKWKTRSGYMAKNKFELSFEPGTVIHVLCGPNSERMVHGWKRGRMWQKKYGLVPVDLLYSGASETKKTKWWRGLLSSSGLRKLCLLK